ncbi:SAM-dependent methyltransferase [Paenibacillus helianthi]|uniref:SAM-dependent methyltransferase n=1 Tax=Paenibacillus helianthi TaxID=1349432 RepID=A0ABX3EKM5_9BACL|nr:class I SAM-dependent methyltransferase [Paenibacillus helianthi]OKP85083.1 SAM-dependent methyltransferase [Paenibacillus helianthi]
MGKRALNLTDELYDYLLQVSLREPEPARKLREETGRMLLSAMQSPPEESQFIALLVKLIGAKRILEIGTFTGYTTLLMAMAMPSDGRIIACDIDDKWTRMGYRYWEEEGVAHKIDLRLAPALDTLDDLLSRDYANYFDFIFIDADKENYTAYYERAIRLIRPGGLIGVDNVLWGGSVINEWNQGPDVREIRSINKTIHQDDRVTVSMLPIGDGLTLAIRNK